MVGVYVLPGINQGIKQGIGCPDCWAWVNEKMHNTLPGQALLLWFTCHARTYPYLDMLCFAKCQDALVGQTSTAHTTAGHQGLGLEVKVRLDFLLWGCWCEKICFVASCNDDGECKQHYNKKKCQIFPHDGESKQQCNGQEHWICFQGVLLLIKGGYYIVVRVSFKI